MRLGVERHEAWPEQGWHQKLGDGGPPWEFAQDRIRSQERGKDGHHPRRHVEEGGRLGLVPEPGDQRGRECCNDARGDDDYTIIDRR